MTSPISTKFQTLLTESLSDKKIENKELSKLRKAALTEIKKSKAPLETVKAYCDVFEGLTSQAADPKAVTFTKQVAVEFETRVAHQKVADALKAAGSKLPASLAGIDLKNVKVGNTLNRGVYLEVPFKTWSKDPNQYAPQQEAREAALKSWAAAQPALKDLKNLWFLVDAD